MLAAEGVLIGVAGAAGATGLETAFAWAGYATVAAVPLAFLVGLARNDLFRMGAIAGLVERLRGRIGSDDLRDALAQASRRPDALRSPSGCPTAVSLRRRRRGTLSSFPRPAGSGRAATPIERVGHGRSPR